MKELLYAINNELDLIYFQFSLPLSNNNMTKSCVQYLYQLRCYKTFCNIYGFIIKNTLNL